MKEEIYKAYGVPLKYVSCPGCGKVYGHDGTKTCSNCQECSECCECENPDLIDSEEFITIILR